MNDSKKGMDTYSNFHETTKLSKTNDPSQSQITILYKLQVKVIINNRIMYQINNNKNMVNTLIIIPNENQQLETCIILIYDSYNVFDNSCRLVKV